MKNYKNLLYLLFGLMLFGCPSTNNNEYTLLSCSTYEKSNEYANKVEENISDFPKNCSGSFAVSDSDFKPPVGCDAGKCNSPVIPIPEYFTVENMLLNLYTYNPNDIIVYLLDDNGNFVTDLIYEILSYDENLDLVQIKIKENEFVYNPTYIVTLEVPFQVKNKTIKDKLQVRFKK